MKRKIMATKLNKRAFEHAKDLISNGKSVQDEKDKWSKHQPSAEKENKFIEENGISEYGKWYLGIEDKEDENNKGHYKFPYGDFQNVHRCGLLPAETRAGQYKHVDIENAVAHLHGMLDK
jgi:hypothetical protein